jgi:hypothetical protein
VTPRCRRSSRATASTAPTTISSVSTAKIRYAVSESNSVSGVSSTVSSGGLRFVSLAGVW